MFFSAIKIVLSACIIAFASWLSNKKPDLAEFTTELPLGTMLVLLFSHAGYHGSAASVRVAKGILVAVPMSPLFFVSFLLTDKLHFGFRRVYASGIALPVIGYFAYGFILKQL